MLPKLRALYQDAAEEMLEDYLAFLRFPSISADATYAEELRSCAEWVLSYLRGSDLEARLVETPGYPLVYAEWMQAGPDKPTVLVYGHYDVQPTDPLDQWITPPFEPSVREGKVFARGAQDNKGQIFYTMAAVRALLQGDGTLPVNFKFCIEGEEETKSRGLAAVIFDHGELLAADVLIAPDFDVGSLEQPSICAGMRGVMGLSVELKGSKTDLHSGMHGGLVYNPNHALVAMLASLRDERGRILVPNFYEAVKMPGASERQQLDLSFDTAGYEAAFETKANGGEADFGPAESGTLRPTLEINGVAGGYAGPGIKTVIPARARAVISCRLVPEQNPKVIFEAIRSFLAERTPEGMELTVKHFGGAPAVRTNPASRGNQALAAVYQELFGKAARFKLSGATVPITGDLVRVSGAEPVLMGLGLPSDDIHAPNEHFDLQRLELGFLIVARLLQELGGDHCGGGKSLTSKVPSSQTMPR